MGRRRRRTRRRSGRRRRRMRRRRRTALNLTTSNRCWGTKDHSLEHNNQGAPDIWGVTTLLQRSRAQQPRSPRHLGRHNSTTEKQGTTTKEPQTFGGGDLHYREAEYNNQGAPDIWGGRALLQRGRVQQPQSPRHSGMQSTTAQRQSRVQ